MNKEEILKKARQENVNGDEREKELLIKRDAFSLWGLTVLGIIIMIIKLMRAQPISDILSILFCTSGLGFTYQGYKAKNKWITASGIVFLIACIYFFYKFL